MKTAMADLQDCIENCLTCHRLCVEHSVHCLSKGGAHADPAHIRLLLDCADICHASANFMLRMSPLHHLICGACALVCTRCADDCKRLADGDDQMAACAQACRDCAQTCAAMSER